MDTLPKKISCFSILFFGTFALFPNEKRGILIALLLLSSIFLVLKSKKFKLHRLVIINSVLYLSYIIALIYTSDVEGALKRFETGASLLLIPIIFSVFYYHEKKLFSEEIKFKLYKIFHWSNVIFSVIICLFFAKLKFLDSQSGYGYWMSHLERRLPFLNDHPIYISMIFCSSILMSLSYLLSKNKTKRFKIIYGLSTIILIGIVLFLSRKGVILALLIAMVIIITFYFKNNIRKLVIVVVSGLLVFGSILFAIPQTKKRISEMVRHKTYTTENETNSTNNRLQIYKCAYDLILEKPVLGYGIEDDRKKLYDCYKKRLYYLYEFEYNTHNQYLSILMKTGLVGLLLFMSFLFFNLKLAFRAGDYLGFGLIVFFIINMMFENILERQNGVLLFTFLINFFSFNNYSHKRNLSN